MHQFTPAIWGKSGGATQLKTFSGDPDGVAAAIIITTTARWWRVTFVHQFQSPSGTFLVEKHALLREDGMVVDLGNLGGSGTLAGHHACAFNKRGQAMGHSPEGRNDVSRLALGIGDQGITVGASPDASFNPRAIVFEDGGMTNLSSMLSSNPQKLYVLFAGSINARREIVGLGAASDGVLHGFMASPDRGEGGFRAFEGAASLVRLPVEARKAISRQLETRGR